MKKKKKNSRGEKSGGGAKEEIYRNLLRKIMMKGVGDTKSFWNEEGKAKIRGHGAFPGDAELAEREEEVTGSLGLIRREAERVVRCRAGAVPRVGEVGGGHTPPWLSGFCASCVDSLPTG